MLILDTSVVLNLVGTGDPRLILKHLREKVCVPPAVLKEVQREPHTDGELSLSELIEDGVIVVIECTSEINALALELAGAPSPDDLGDGESFAISCAACLEVKVGIDDQKARRILRAHWPKIVQWFTIDLIALAANHGNLRAAHHAELVYLALRNARMRVPKERRMEIAKLIGNERARDCPSLGFINNS
jgi:predicted nucleic acid-binding protein